MSSLQQRGDTIVEVLIAILVVSVILSGAFVSARKSQSGIRQTEERVEALKVTEAQIERLKAVVSTSYASVVPTSDATFCVDSTNERVDISGGIKPLANDTLGASNDYHPAACNIAPAEGIIYYSTIEYKRASNSFIVYTRWDGAGGIGPQEVVLAIRIDP